MYGYEERYSQIPARTHSVGARFRPGGLGRDGTHRREAETAITRAYKFLFRISFWPYGFPEQKTDYIGI